MTSHVLHHLRELQTAWRKQDFKLTRQQQEEYDILLTARRERVRGFYAEGRVFKGSKAAFDKENAAAEVEVEVQEED
jgi:hypothetical protein